MIKPVCFILQGVYEIIFYNYFSFLFKNNRQGKDGNDESSPYVRKNERRLR